jgi:hypothetical protein
MLEAWNKIQKSLEYWDYNPQDRARIKAEWFRENIAPTSDFQSYGEDDQVLILNEFAKYANDVHPESSFWDAVSDIPKATMRGVGSAIEAGAGTMGLLGIPGGEKVKKYGEEISQDPAYAKPRWLSEGTVLEHPERFLDLRWYLNLGLENLPNMAAMMIPGGLAYKGAKVAGWGLKASRGAGLLGGATGAFSIESGAAYNEALADMSEDIKAGTITADEAQKIARVEGVVVGIANSLLEIAPFNVLLKNPGSKKMLGRAIRYGWQEGGTEGIQENINMFVAEMGHDPDVGLKEKIGRTIESTIAGTMLGAGAGAIIKVESESRISDATNVDEAVDAFNEAVKAPAKDAFTGLVPHGPPSPFFPPHTETEGEALLAEIERQRTG